MKFNVILFFALLPSGVFADNLFSNSDMATTGAWRGSRTFTELEDEKVIVVKANPRRGEAFTQDAVTRGVKDVIIKFRYLTEDYEGRGLQLRGTRPDGSSTYRNISVVSDGKWQTASWDFSEIQNANKITFSFSILEGNGSIYFDDVTLTPK